MGVYSDWVYKIQIDDILNTKYNSLQFQGKIELINKYFSREFSAGLFNSKKGEDNFVTVEKIFDIFNIKKDDTYKQLYNKRDEIFNICLESIFGCTTYFELRKNFLSVDKLITGKMPLNQFMNIMKKILNSKLSDENLLHL